MRYARKYHSYLHRETKRSSVPVPSKYRYLKALGGGSLLYGRKRSCAPNYVLAGKRDPTRSSLRRKTLFLWTCGTMKYAYKTNIIRATRGNAVIGHLLGQRENENSN